MIIFIIMSDLSELIKINRNIEKQNEEIIRLLRKIAGEEEPSKVDAQLDGFSEMIKKSIEHIGEEGPRKANFNIPKSPDSRDLLNTEIGIGEVYFVEDGEIFKLTHANNETTIDNLTGSTTSNDYNLLEIVARETIKRNQSLSDSTVILTKSQAQVLPESLRICYDEGAKKVYMPWSLIPQLVGAPDTIVEILNISFYKTDDELIEMIFD